MGEGRDQRGAVGRNRIGLAGVVVVPRSGRQVTAVSCGALVRRVLVQDGTHQNGIADEELVADGQRRVVVGELVEERPHRRYALRAGLRRSKSVK